MFQELGHGIFGGGVIILSTSYMKTGLYMVCLIAKNKVKIGRKRWKVKLN